MTHPKILIVDDEPFNVDYLEQELEELNYETISATNGQEALDKVRGASPDVILLDLVMPRMDGVQASLEIKKAYSPARILVLTSFSEDHMVVSAIRAGAIGYLVKDTSSEDLLQAIRDTYRNQPVLGPEIARKLMEEIQGGESQAGSVASLTEREVEILQQMALGLTNQEIADVLVLSERTVRTHVTNILAKLGLSNRTQAVLYALRAGIAHIDYRREE